MTGEGILKDERRALELFDGACQKDLPIACYNLAVMVEDGKGTTKNRERAKELHEKACKAGFVRSCRVLPPAKP